MKLFLRLTQDKYEHILDLDESLTDLAERWGDRPSSVTEYMARVKEGKINPDHPKYASVEVEADAEILDRRIERCAAMCRAQNRRSKEARENAVKKCINRARDFRELPEEEKKKVFKLIYQKAYEEEDNG